MARGDGIHRTSARNARMKDTDIDNAQAHNEREKSSYVNQDIVPERTPYNVHFKTPPAGYKEMFEQMRSAGVISTRGLKADAEKFGELIFDVNSAYFFNHGGYEFAKQFYTDAYKAAIKIVGGEQYILSAVMHADERNRAMSEALGQDVYHYITMVIVHHTRKLEADDKFDMIAGTNGLLGAADGGFVLSKEKRTSNAAVLDVTGRDQEDQRLHLNKNPETLVWELESVETELWQEPPDPFLESIAAFLSSAGERWEGTASELCCLLNLDCKPNVLSLRLSISSVRLLRDHDIHYKASRNHGGRKISLWKEMDSVSKGDDRDGLLVGGGEV